MHSNAVADYARSKSLLSYLLVMVALVMALQYFALPTRSNVKVERNADLRMAKVLPDMGLVRTKGSGIYTYSLSLYYSDIELQQTGFTIISGSCVEKIRINNKNVPFKKFGTCDPKPESYWNPYERPIHIELQPHLRNGRNLIEVKTLKAEFNIGPIILYDYTKPAKWIGLTMLLVACIGLVVFIERMTGEWITGYIIACGFAVYVHRISHQPVNQFSMDLPGHIIYFAHIAHTWEIPKTYHGWSFYHAPLYYTLQAVVVWLSNVLRSFDVLTCNRLLSLGFFTTFIIFSALTLKKLITQPLAYYTALVLLVFYPSGIMFAGRIDSNILFYCCYAASLYFLLCWLEKNRKRDLGIALMMLGYSFASRTNAIILIPLFLLAFFYHLILWGRTKGLAENKFIRLGVIIALLGLTVSIGRIEYYRITEARNDPFIVGNAGGLTPKLALEPYSYSKLFIPNLQMYLNRPLWSVWTDNNGRQYFMNSMLKSSMFGEFIWDARWLARHMSKLLLLIIGFTIEGYILHHRYLRRNQQWWLCLVTLAVPIAALMQNRITYPFGCSEDFRYIYPAIMSFCGLVGLVMQCHLRQWRPFRAAIGILLCVSFSLCSAVFYML